MHKIHYILVLMVLALCGCEWKLSPNNNGKEGDAVAVERYDRIESLYLTTGDFSALQQRNTEYPMQTRALIEDVLKIGRVNDPEINSKFLQFFQDITLQSPINEVEHQYANMDDINKELNSSFRRLKKAIPGIDIPEVYTQIGALDQSIVVGNDMVGISLDKYLGADYHLYLKYYPKSQREQMVRSMIVPDCLVFYLLSLYPMPHGNGMSQMECDVHIGKIMWVVNRLVDRHVFKGEYVSLVAKYMKRHKNGTIAWLLNNDNCKDIAALADGK